MDRSALERFHRDRLELTDFGVADNAPVRLDIVELSVGAAAELMFGDIDEAGALE